MNTSQVARFLKMNNKTEKIKRVGEEHQHGRGEAYTI